MGITWEGPEIQQLPNGEQLLCSCSDPLCVCVKHLRERILAVVLALSGKGRRWIHAFSHLQLQMLYVYSFTWFSQHPAQEAELHSLYREGNQTLEKLTDSSCIQMHALGFPSGQYDFPACALVPTAPQEAAAQGGGGCSLGHLAHERLEMGQK